MKDNSLMGALEADEEYRIIQNALLETPRGRWFLTEHGRRSRRIDAALLDDAIHQLQASLRDPPAVLSALKSDVESLRQYIGEERQALVLTAPNPASHNGSETELLQQQTASMLTAAEDLHTLVWSIRDTMPSADLCEAIARQASRIYALSHAQAAQSTHTAKATGALEETYLRLSVLLDTILNEMQATETPRRPAYLPNGAPPLR